MTLRTRRPTGLPSWPLMLINGMPKAGKSYAAVEATTSEHIGRALFIPVGEDDPDELGAMPGADYEIVEHDGSYLGVLGAVVECVDALRGAEKPGLIIVDSISNLWTLITDEAQVRANNRAAEKARKNGRRVPEGDVTIGMDLWNQARVRWDDVMDALREHDGPVILTARAENKTVVENGEPTTQKEWKVQGHRSLENNVDAIVELHERGKVYLTGVKSMKMGMNLPAGRRVPYPGFTVEKLWRDLGVLDIEVGRRRHTSTVAPVSGVLSGRNEGQDVRAEVWQAWMNAHEYASNDEAMNALRADYADATGGDSIDTADDAALRRYLPTIATRAAQAAAAPRGDVERMNRDAHIIAAAVLTEDDSEKIRATLRQGNTEDIYGTGPGTVLRVDVLHALTQDDIATLGIPEGTQRVELGALLVQVGKRLASGAGPVRGIEAGTAKNDEATAGPADATSAEAEPSEEEPPDTDPWADGGGMGPTQDTDTKDGEVE